MEDRDVDDACCRTRSDVYDVLVYTRETEWDKRSYVSLLYGISRIRRLKHTPL